ncbi:filamentous haemagglutinin family protein [Chitinolyticbacter meiyuanensis]|uniref:filamentous haemagglutinin family protein n=1 Tax=Chitinolyticbacter meiyuanensis TaxID=682798 RepID=UPI0011E5EA91|nr:filamentous haemagglutinin family protein [Chitinolyticbacter meiyuanensis]
MTRRTAHTRTRRRFTPRPIAWAIASLLLGSGMAWAAPTPLSPGWLSGKQEVRTQRNSTAPATAGPLAGGYTAAALLQQRTVQQSIANLNAAAAAIVAAQQAQRDAAQFARSRNWGVPDGLAEAGLKLAAGVADDPLAPARLLDAALWQNAQLPTQTSSSGNTTVSIVQTGAKAILNWETFNVGGRTTVHFDQRAGTQLDGSNEWIALNRINDPAGHPSEIRGQIKAEGSVYLLNRNGILFGAGSQVNTHSLLASSLDLFTADVNESNRLFLKKGITAALESSEGDGSQHHLVNGAWIEDGVARQRGELTVERGAQIATGDTGFVIAAAPQLSNDGAITTRGGSLILAGGTSVQLNVAGNTVAGAAVDTNRISPTVKHDDASQSVRNSGLLLADHGDIVLAAGSVRHDGVLAAISGIARPGYIGLVTDPEWAPGTALDSSLRAADFGAITLGKTALIAMLPSDDGETTTSSAKATAVFTPGKVDLVGGAVTLQQNARIVAPGGQVQLAARRSDGLTAHPNGIEPGAVAGRVYLAEGALIDVSGLPDVHKSVADTVLKVGPMTRNDLADSPLLRQGFLYGSTVYVDTTLSGVRGDGLPWVGSPGINVVPYLDNVPRGVRELLVNGGTINLSGTEVISRSGSQLRMEGGFLNYEGGRSNGPTRLLGADGRSYDPSRLDPDLLYVGFAGQYTQAHARWGVDRTYVNPLLAGTVAQYRAGYVEGAAAGKLKIEVAGSAVLQGEVAAHAYAGIRQVAGNQRPSGGALVVTSQTAEISESGRRYSFGPNILVTDTLPDLGERLPGFGADTVLRTPEAIAGAADDRNNLLNWLPLETDRLTDSGLARIALSSKAGAIELTPEAQLQVVPGGEIDLTAIRVGLAGHITAQAGHIDVHSIGSNDLLHPYLQPDRTAALPTPGGIQVASGTVLDASGLWVNDAGQDGSHLLGSQYVDGGAISLAVDKQASQPLTDGSWDAGTQGGDYVDVSGSLTLQAGSLLDVGSGGYVAANGKLKTAGGLPVGKGGNIKLAVYDGGDKTNFGIVPERPSAGRLQLDGTLKSSGFAGGGTLELHALGITIGTSATLAAQEEKPYATLQLDDGFFARQGFGAYRLYAEYDAGILPGANVQVSQLLRQAPSDAQLAALPSDSTLDLLGSARVQPALQPATHFSLSAGNHWNWGAVQDLGGWTWTRQDYAGIANQGSVTLGEGALLHADPGAQVTLQSFNRITVDGHIEARGGAITLSGDLRRSALTRSGLLHPELDKPIDNFDTGKSIWLGQHSVLDASGIVLPDLDIAPLAGRSPATHAGTGQVLAGGSVTLSTDTGFIAALPGARIDVSGTQGQLDVLAPAPVSTGLAQQGAQYRRQTIGSNGGSIVLAGATGLYFDGTLAAAGGQGAVGGSLYLLPISPNLKVNDQGTLNGELVLMQHGLTTGRAGLALPGDLPQAPANVKYFALDRLDGSGIAGLHIDAPRAYRYPADGESEFGRQSLVLAGDIDLQLGRAFTAMVPTLRTIDLPEDGSLPQPTLAQTGTEATHGQVSITAPLIQLRGDPTRAQVDPASVRGAATLTLAGQHIDLAGSVSIQGTGVTQLQSDGDIRLSGQLGTTGWNPGLLYTAGDLELAAAQIYPTTGSTFGLIASSGGLLDDLGEPLPTAIRITQRGQAGAPPLSAGGALLIAATTIEQGGTLRAPSGHIVLGSIGDQDGNFAPLSNALNGMPPPRTDMVTLSPGSTTSVSLAGLTVPYGITVDGTNWQYSPYTPQPREINAPPEKQILINAGNIALQDGATVDLSGGGDLLGLEWVPGTGGTRDVLARYNVSYAQSSAGTQVPLYPDQRGVYAILPGYTGAVAPVDPVLEPGQAPIEAGRSVYLAGVPGLADGTYTLLPARYATLPGAYRLVERSGQRDSVPAENRRLADGTIVAAGYYVDGFSGVRDARSSTFELQDRDTWTRYSEYTFTGANRFFADQAARRDQSAPMLPRDGGQLVIGARDSLSLGAQVKAAADQGGSAAQIDIAARQLQIVGTPAAQQAGYLQLPADQLSTLAGGSLLLGGTRSAGKEGVVITPLATDIQVANDAAHPLEGSEILLATRALTTDEIAAGESGSLAVQSGAVVLARGEHGGSVQRPLVIGRDAAGMDPGTSGDGALLRVSTAWPVKLQRHNLPDTPTALVDIQDGARLNGGNTLLVDASGDTRIAAAAILAGRQIEVNSSRITFSSGQSAASGMTVGTATLQQLASAQTVVLRSYGDIDFLDPAVSIELPGALTLSAGGFVSHDNAVAIQADTLTLANTLAAPMPDAATGTATLMVNASELRLGAGDKRLVGFGALNGTLSRAVVGEDTGSTDLGTATLQLATPVLQAGQGSSQTLITSGNATLQANGQAASAARPAGGSLTLQAAAIRSNTGMRANAGRLTLHATQGDLLLDDGSDIDVSGLARAIFDATLYAPGGVLTLRADQGNVVLAGNAALRFGAAAAGGDGGALTIRAPRGQAQLVGQLHGTAAGRGSDFALDTAAAIDLDHLADTLTQAGVAGELAIRSQAGNLTLSSGRTLRGSSIELVADGDNGSALRDTANGNIRIDGTLDARGSAGGQIALWGKNGVAVNGSLLASGSRADKRGGDVVIGTSGKHNGNLNNAFGYQDVTPESSGRISIGSGAVIDVSGGSAGGLSGGTLALRAPLLTNGEVAIDVAQGAQIRGSRATTVEAYAVWSTTDAVVDPTQHFDGIIDPAGWFDVTGLRVAGTWIDHWGNPLMPPSTPEEEALYQSRYFFTPDAANTDHQTFYGYRNGDAAQGPGTLMGFIQNPGFAFESRLAHLPNLRARPGIELRNPDGAINDGAIRLLTNWNLGAGPTPDQLVFRYQGQAPAITLRAEGDIVLQASLTDGFYQRANPLGTTNPFGAAIKYAPHDSGLGPYDSFRSIILSSGYSAEEAADFVQAPALLGEWSGADPLALARYYGLYNDYIQFLANPIDLMGSFGFDYAYLLAQRKLVGEVDYPGQPIPPAVPSDLNGYADYLQSYKWYVMDLVTFWQGTGQADLPRLAPLAPPARIQQLPDAMLATDNTPSPIATLANPAPLATATLFASGDSSSYRLVAGATAGSAAPVSVDSNQGGQIEIASHRITHQIYDDSTFYYPYERDIALPNLIRTGTGSIELAAAGDILLRDKTAPGVIYTAGLPVEGTSFVPSSYLAANGNPAYAELSNLLLANAEVHPAAAGDIRLTAGGDITGNQQVYDEDGSKTGFSGNYLGQYWTTWLWARQPIGDIGVISSINFSHFGQGVMSVGGDIAVTAAGDVRELSLSAPTTYTGSSEVTSFHGGGDITVKAGRDLIGGSVFVSKGDASLTVGRDVKAAFTLRPPNLFNQDGSQAENDISTVFALQNGHIDLQAGRHVDIGAVVNPALLTSPVGGNIRSDLQRYGETASVSFASAGGDIQLGTLIFGNPLFANGYWDGAKGVGARYLDLLPPNVVLHAAQGGIRIAQAGQLFPAQHNQLEVIAASDILMSNLRSDGFAPTSLYLGIARGTAADFPSPEAGLPSTWNPSTDAALDNNNAEAASLHRDDHDPVRLYTLSDLVNGVEGTLLSALTLRYPKPVWIRAGGDIINLALSATHSHAGDVTRIEAGRDIYDVAYALDPSAPRDFYGALKIIPVIALGGPGTLEIQAGRHLGPFTSQTELAQQTGGISPAEPLPELRNLTGINTIGNVGNSFLPRQSADIVVRVGVGPGLATEDFIARHIAPDTRITDAPDLSPALITFMQRRSAEEGELTAEAAWQGFQALPAEAQQLFVDQALFTVLGTTARDYHDAASPYRNQYARGYEAINTLFPASLGYTANNLAGGSNGAAELAHTGDLDLRGTTIQTQQGGDIRILAPGGQALLGSASALPASITPNQTGVLTLERGGIDIFLDRSLLLAQSRVFTEQGGDMLIWSSNGDINAGKGARTTAELPRSTYVCNLDQHCRIDARGLVSGAGIATLQTIPGAPSGDVLLVAPRGTVDAGDAGIRVSGNLYIAAQSVANAFNVDVQGEQVGVPTIASVNVAALTSGDKAANAAAQAAQEVARQQQSASKDKGVSLITVDILGFGEN